MYRDHSENIPRILAPVTKVTFLQERWIISNLSSGNYNSREFHRISRFFPRLAERWLCNSVFSNCTSISNIHHVQSNEDCWGVSLCPFQGERLRCPRSWSSSPSVVSTREEECKFFHWYFFNYLRCQKNSK